MTTEPTPAPDWNAIRYRYVETDAALSAIVHDAGITHTQFETARKRGDWRRKKPRGSPPGRRPPSSAISADTGTQKRRRNPGDAASPPEGAAATSLAPDTSATAAPFVIPPVPTDERELVTLYRTLIWLKLLQLEESMKSDLTKKKGAKRATSSDHEREARVITSLIQNTGHTKEMQADIARHEGTLTDPDLAREAERYQREFTEHLEKILKGQEQEEA